MNAFYRGTTAWMAEGRAMDFLCLDSSRALHTISLILAGKPSSCGWVRGQGVD